MNEDLRPVAEDVWVASRALSMPGGVRIPVNMTVIRLRDRSLLLHAPIALDDTAATALATLGPVRYVVAPNSFHHLFVTACLARYPEAALYLAPGLPTKRPDLTATGILGAGTPPPWAAEVDCLVVDGAPKLREVAFFHRASGSLLVTDLLFNVTDPANVATGLVLRLMGTHRRLAVSRAWRFHTRDKKAQRPTLEALLAWPFVRIVPGHGVVYEGAPPLPDARVAARAAFGSLLA
ncbi:MAG TPA: DUF4336 domain-containing protein [Polyangia bacterium]|jgi:hypothetical protein